MPIYEYQCSKCGEIFEAIQKVSDEPLRACKFCGGKVDRLISQSSFQLKGSGWYLTDYARKAGDSEKKTDTGGKPATKSDKTEKSASSTPAAEKSPS